MKVLCCGDVEGRFAEVWARVRKIEASNGPFDALFCVGQFYGVEGPTVELPAAPVPTWVLEGGGAGVEAGAELGENVRYLGTCGVATVRERCGGPGAKVMENR